MGWRDDAIPIDAHSTGSWKDDAIALDAPSAGSWKDNAIPLGAPEQPQQPQQQEQLTEEQKEGFRLAAEREATIASEWKRGGESNLPGVRAGAVRFGTGLVAPVLRAAKYDKLANRLERTAKVSEQVQQEREAGGLMPDWLQRAARGAGVSLATAGATGMFMGPWGIIGSFSAQEASRARQEGWDAGLRGKDLSKHVLIAATIEAAPAAITQKFIPLRTIETLLGGGKGAAASGLKEGFKQFAKIMAVETGEELLTEGLHLVEGARSGIDPGALTGESMKRTAIDTIAQTWIAAGTASSPGLVSSYKRGKAEKAEGEHGRILKAKYAIVAQAESGKAPSVAWWKSLGLPANEGSNRKARLEAVQGAAEEINAEYQAKADKVAQVQAEKTAQAGQKAPGGLIEGSLNLPQAPQEEQPGAAEEPPHAPQGPQGLPEASSQVEPDTQSVQPPSASEHALGASPATQQPGQPQATQADAELAAMGVSPKVHDFPVEIEGTGERIGGREVVRRLEKIWGKKAFAGRIRARKARGVFSQFSEHVRMAKGEESSSAVYIHETVGHYLDKTTDIRKNVGPQAEAELKKLDYDPKARRVSEGFAEFVRGYLTGGTERQKGGIDLSKEAPNFLQHFETWLSDNPEVAAKIEASREPLLAYKRAGAVGRVKGQISKSGVDKRETETIRERLEGWKDFLYSRIKEEGLAVKRFSDVVKKKKSEQGLGAGDEPAVFENYNALRQIGPHFAAKAFENGVFLLSGEMEQIAPGVAGIMSEITTDEDYSNFMTWAYARHAVESWSYGKNPGITLADAEEVVKQLYDPRYEKAADGLTVYGDALVKVQEDVGVISEEEGRLIVGKYKTHLPLWRAVEKSSAGSKGRKMVNLSKPFHGRKGSGLQILDPVETLLAITIRTYERAATQVVTNKLVEDLGTVEGLGDWGHEVPAKLAQEHFSFEAVRTQIGREVEEQTGEDIRDILKEVDPLTAMSVWRPDLMVMNGQPIVRVIVEGKPLLVQLRPELAESLGGLETLHNIGLTTKVARTATGLLKMGATRLNPSFILSNIVRDYQTFLMQGERGLKGAFDPAKYAGAYMFMQLQHAQGKLGEPVAELFQKMGGELSTYAGLDRARLRAGVKRAVKGKQGAFTTASNLIGTSEVASRISEFAAILEKEGWLQKVRDGHQPPMRVLVRAINAAHDVTTDFRRMGKWGRYLNYYIPFFNARLEGFDKFVRTLKDRPGRSAMRVITAIVPLAMTYWWLRHDDDDYKERPEWQDRYFILKGEGGAIYRIPKSHEWGLFESAVERMMDTMYDKDPEAMNRWFREALGTVNPAGMPSGVTPVFEGLTNYDTFRGRPIVSRQIQNREKRDQYNDYTSEVAKGIAELLHESSDGAVQLSPAKLDHLANGLTGGLYGKVNSPLEKAISGDEWEMSDIPGLKGITLRKDYPKSNDDFYSRFEELTKESNSAKLRGKEIEEGAADELRRLGYVKTLMSNMRKASHDLSKEDKKKVSSALTGLARKALGKEQLDSYPNPMADPSILPKKVGLTVYKHLAKKIETARGGGKHAFNASKYIQSMVGGVQ